MLPSRLSMTIGGGWGGGAKEAWNIYIYIYIWYPPPPKIDHFLCFVFGDTSQNLQGLGLLASQLHLASTLWLHRMNMLKKPEETKKTKTSKSSCICLLAAQDEQVEKTGRNQKKEATSCCICLLAAQDEHVEKNPKKSKNQTNSKKSGSWERMPRSESRKVNKPRRNQKKYKK